MSKKLKVIKTLEILEDCQDVKGTGIPKGTRLFVITECPPAP